MSTTIVKYVQGQNGTDNKLFCLVGGFALNAKIHTEMGSAITGQNGDVWYFWLDANAKPFGFANVRPLKTKQEWHLRFLYGEGIAKIKSQLMDYILEDARRVEMPVIFTNGRENDGFWKLFNFAPGDTRKGAFIRWEKKL